MVLEVEAAKALGAAIAIFGGAIGVIAEKPDQASKLLVWLVIPESIVIFGFIVAAVLLFL